MNRYIPLDYSDDIDDGFFDYTQYGKAVFKPRVNWKAHTRNDIITYNHAYDWYELNKGIKIGNMASAESKERLISIIKSIGTVSAKMERVLQSLGTNSRSTMDHTYLCVVKCQGTDHMNQVL